MLQERIGSCSVMYYLPDHQRTLPTDDTLPGTDHPFFPPLDNSETEWQSVTQNSSAVKSAFGNDASAADAVMGSNAMRVLKLI